jgi:hypothetical protein
MRIATILLAFLSISSVTQSQAVNPNSKNWYEIKAQIKPFKNGHYFLAYHFGNKQFLIDSAKLDLNGSATFKGDKKLQGGIYMIVFPEKNGWIECIVDQQQHFTIFADTSNLVKSISFTGSTDNVIFNDYQKKSFEI